MKVENTLLCFASQCTCVLSLRIKYNQLRSVIKKLDSIITSYLCRKGNVLPHYNILLNLYVSYIYI